MTDTRAPDPPRRHDPPLSRLETVTVLGAVAALGVLLTLVSFTRPASATTQRDLEYRQSAAFTYSADTAADSIYGDGGLETGETVVLDEVSDLEVRVAYQIAADPAEVQVTGTAALVARVTVAGGLRRSFPITTTPVDGSTAVLEGEVPLENMVSYLERSRTLLGPAGETASAAVDLEATFEGEGTAGGRALRASFAPVLALSLTGDTLAVDSDSGETLAADDVLLNPSETGRVTFSERVPATFSLLVADPRVSVVRWVALGITSAALLALALVGWGLRGAGNNSEAERILARHGSRMVSVVALDTRDGPIADVASIEDVIELAKRYESAVMHARDDDGDVFMVWDTGFTYRYRARPLSGDS